MVTRGQAPPGHGAMNGVSEGRFGAKTVQNRGSDRPRAHPARQHRSNPV